MASSEPRYAVGVDYGTNSVRALIVEVGAGREIASRVFAYPSGEDGILLDPRDPNVARQNPADYIAGFYAAVGGAVKRARAKKGFDPARVAGIGVDTTGSTPLPVNRHGTPLALLPKFKENLAAQAWLWKDHTAHEEAAAITAAARRAGAPYLDKCGGAYSSEWFWSKIRHCQRTAPAVFAAAFSWVECCDFIPAYITGNLDPLTMKRSICAAGHKAMYNDGWGGLPSKKFLARLSPELAALRDRLYQRAETSDQVAGRLLPEVAKSVGLPAGIPVAVGAFDAHMGAVGAGIKPGTLVKIIGTSTCDMMVAPAGTELADIPGVCGIVPGSIVPGMYGIEAGQSAVGDIFNWFVAHLTPPEYATGDAHSNLSRAAARLKPGESGLLALDWNNGNRTILVDPLLTGLLVGQTLHTTAPEIYRALIEATAFGALTIVRRIEEYGVAVKEVVNCGGIAEKNPLLMQIYADVLNRPMKISAASQTCALGAAIFGAVAGGAVKDLKTARERMTGTRPRVFRPDAGSARVYAKLYPLYRRLHDAFGTPTHAGEMSRLMKELIAIRDRARTG
jgi:L-ribulokinase